MTFLRTEPRRGADGVVPMINVAFLLLVFFLMMARLAPPDPLEVMLPDTAGGEPADIGDVLLIAASGETGFRDLRGEAVYAAIAGRGADAPLSVRADRALAGAELARVLTRLAEVGTVRVQLVAVPR